MHCAWDGNDRAPMESELKHRRPERRGQVSLVWLGITRKTTQRGMSAPAGSGIQGP